EEGGREIPVGHVAAPFEEGQGLVDRGGEVDHPARAAATARRAITETRWARYSALASLSTSRSAEGTAIPSSASGAKRPASAFSIDATRNTLGPAPVTATRVPAGPWATITPTSAYLEAWLANLA